MKYIVLDDGERELPIIFPDDMNHIDIATAITNLDEYKSCRLVAGGFIQVGPSLCSGSSKTLAINSRPEDQALINGYDYSHGIKDCIDDIDVILKGIDDIDVILKGIDDIDVILKGIEFKRPI